MPASPHFSDKNHNFNTHAKFTLIEQLGHIDIGKEKNKERTKQGQNFWILTLEALTLEDLKALMKNLIEYIILFTYFYLPNAC